MLLLGKGSDCTELFESCHLYNRLPKALLKKYYLQDEINYRTSYSWNSCGFYNTLKSRVREHFDQYPTYDQWGIHKLHGTYGFIARLLILIVLYLLITWLAIVKGSLISACIWPILALALGGYGHEANHGGVFHSHLKNRILAFLSMDLTGISSYVYAFVHNCHHHIHTNIEEVDPDVEIHYPIIRLFNYQKHHFYHRFQHYYIWFFYFIALIPANIMDVLSIVSGKWGEVKIPRPNGIEFFLFLLGKILNVIIFFILPFYFHTPSHALVLILIMMGLGGLVINIAFAMSHKNNDCMQFLDQYKSDESIDWGIAQTRSTCNYHHGHWLTDMLFAGLGYQIEHHLFPLISYSRLPEIAPIVRQTCQEFQIPYHYHTKWYKALSAHFHFVHKMGRP